MQVLCSSCGTVFQSRLFGGGPNVMLTIKNISISEQCPNCLKSTASIKPGKYSFNREGILQLFSGEEFTQEVLTQLRDLTELANQQALTIEEYKRRATAITPAAAGLGRFMPSSSGDLASWFQGLLALIAILIAQYGGEKPTIVNNTYNTYNTYEQVSPPKPSTWLEDARRQQKRLRRLESTQQSVKNSNKASKKKNRRKR